MKLNQKIKIRNPGLKFASLIIAILLGFYVTGETNSSVISFGVPITVKNLPPDKIIILPTVRRAEVTVRGPNHLISRIYSSSPTFKVKLPDELGDRFKATLVQKDLAFSPSIDILSIEPSSIELIFDNLLTKKVTVSVPKIGSINNNYKLESLTINPPSVEVQGAETELSEVVTVETEPLDLRNVKGDTTIKKELQVPGIYTKVIDPENGLVDIDLKVSSIEFEKSFENVPIEVRAQGEKRFSVFPNRVTVEVTGTKSALKGLKKRDVVPYVRIRKDNTVGSSIQIQVDLPDGVSLVMIEPSTVKFAASGSTEEKGE